MLMYNLNKVKCCLYRGGTSRGVFFHSGNVPDDAGIRERMFLGIMGTPDIRQIDGLGGATTHTSKVVIIHPSSESGIDIEYEFIQVGIDLPILDAKGMCGNLLSAAGVFAVDEGLVKAIEPETVVSVKNRVTEKRYLIRIPVKNGQSVTQGSHFIDGVASPGAPIEVEFIDPAGTVADRILPTGNPVDSIATEQFEYKVSIVDAGHIHLFARLEDFHLTGREEHARLQEQSEMMTELENLRGRAAVLCGFAKNPTEARTQCPARPRITLVGYPIGYTSLYSRAQNAEDMDIRSITVSMERFHQSIPLSSAIGLGAAAGLPSTIVHNIVNSDGLKETVRIGHPSGILPVCVESAKDPSNVAIKKVSAIRTARKLMEGFAWYPQ